MTTKAAFIKRRIAGTDCLVPMDEDGREIMAALSEDRQVMVKVHAARNVRHHRMLFALLRRCTDAGPWDGDEESLLTWLKIGTGLVDTVIGPNGKPYYLPRSIAFESMSQDRFARWFDRAVYLISTRILGCDDWQKLRDEIAEIVDGDLGRRAREHDERFGRAA